MRYNQQIMFHATSQRIHTYIYNFRKLWTYIPITSKQYSNTTCSDTCMHKDTRMHTPSTFIRTYEHTHITMYIYGISYTHTYTKRDIFVQIQNYPCLQKIIHTNMSDMKTIYRKSRNYYSVYVCMNVCVMSVHTCVCTCIYIYTYIHTYIHIYTYIYTFI